MNQEIVLPNSQYIDTNLGLKYLNGNKKLYLKILNSFLVRYKDFDIKSLKDNEFKNEMHTLKGLSSTLGMESLSSLAQTLHTKRTKELLIDFSETLTVIITDLRTTKTKTLLIVDNNSDDIDSILEILDDNYDIMVTTTPNDDLESLSQEHIDIVLLNSALSNERIKNKFKQKRISIIELYKPIKLNNLLLVINNV